MQPCESRRNFQPETAETDFFHTFGKAEDGTGAEKQKFMGMSAIWQ